MLKRLQIAVSLVLPVFFGTCLTILFVQYPVAFDVLETYSFYWYNIEEFKGRHIAIILYGGVGFLVILYSITLLKRKITFFSGLLLFLLGLMWLFLAFFTVPQNQDIPILYFFSYIIVAPALGWLGLFLLGVNLYSAKNSWTHLAILLAPIVVPIAVIIIEDQFGYNGIFAIFNWGATFLLFPVYSLLVSKTLHKTND